jgi:hypothetical protein
MNRRDEQERIDLEKLISQHKRNKRILESQKAFFAAGEIPLHLLNQIENEEQEIAKWQAELDALNAQLPPPYPEPPSPPEIEPLVLPRPTPIRGSGTEKQPEPKPQPPEQSYESYCTELHCLLEKREWKAADQETNRVILRIAEQQARKDLQILRTEDIEQFPSSALKAIDIVWKEFSNSRFGFSIQRQIWREIVNQPHMSYRDVNNQIEAFGKQLGWCVDGQWLREYHRLRFNLEAPKGHLPSLRIALYENDTSWWQTWKRNIIGFLSRSEVCFLDES